MVLLMMAAPALVPAITPPRRYIAHSASSTAVLLPSGRRSAPRDAGLVAAGEEDAAGLADRLRQRRIVGRLAARRCPARRGATGTTNACAP